MIRIIMIMGYFIGFLLSQLPWYFIYPSWDKKGLKQKRYNSASQKIDKVFHKALTMSGSQITVSGQENIPKDQAVLFVANHSSYCDIPVLYDAIPGGAGFIAKKEMEKIPLLAQWMRFLNSEFLDRNDIKQGMQVIKDAAATIKDGYSIVIFPEGTRSQDDEPHEFKEGSLRIASIAKAPVIPVAISGTADMMENHHKFRIYPADVHVTFGKPIYMNELPRAEKKHLGAAIRQWIIDTNNAL
ncbi:MAG: lysophospholipid acyltransferase family protein [Lachnospiraceae bacterium]|nr:lysophospholipid acyltransferase family protein [Lachnospiraceae bacterium]